MCDVLEIHQVPMLDERPITPPSRAVRAARKQLSPKPQTPRFDPEMHTLDGAEGNRESAGKQEEDSFVRTIGSRTPVKMTRDEASGKDEQAIEALGGDPGATKEDSFVEQIVARSPAKSTTRIEDSVEAIDALEDAIEQVGDALPMVQDSESPVKTKKVKPVPSEPADPSASGPWKAALAQKQTKATVPAKTPAAKKTTTVTRTQISVAKTMARPVQKPVQSRTRVSIRTTAVTAKAPSPKPTDSKRSAAIATAVTAEPPAAKKRPVSATLKAPFQPSKSTKPPTRPTFELPGEAISRKLKEQREERLKHEEEEKQKKREFKARPVRLSHAPAVKPTAASKARASLLHQEPGTGSNDHAPKIKALGRVSSIGSDKGPRRESVLSVAKRPAATTSVPRGPSFAGSTISRNPSTTGPVAKAAVTSAEVAQQKMRAREIFGRDRQEKGERERIRKDKEEAAKKARAEAAERGRQASREWAEKQKVKKAAGGGSGEVKADQALHA